MDGESIGCECGQPRQLGPRGPRLTSPNANDPGGPMFRSICRLTFLVAAVAATAPLAATEAPLDQAARTLTNDEWCVDTLDRQHDHRESVCEVREFTLPAGSVGVETSNGGIRVTGSDRSDILVRAIV